MLIFHAVCIGYKRGGATEGSCHGGAIIGSWCARMGSIGINVSITMRIVGGRIMRFEPCLEGGTISLDDVLVGRRDGFPELSCSILKVVPLIICEMYALSCSWGTSCRLRRSTKNVVVGCVKG